jgi:hypothetical protein
LTVGRADPVDGITGEEDQERGEERVPDEKFGRWIEGPPPPTEPWRIVEPGIEVEVRGERYLIGDCNDVLGIGAFGAEFTRDDIERWRRIDRETAYRAGREDAAREAGLTCQDEAEWLLGPRPSPSSHFHECIRERGHLSSVHRCQCGMSWRPGNQRSDGVQPTEEQRAVAEDQKRDEENP